jgi:4-amino-4-deoxy-L-arabinose transferase-like glycosyltransferase
VTGEGKNFFRSVFSDERRADYAAAGIILLYCVVWASLRLLVSTTMELDDAEQFVAAKVLSLGYIAQGQPPLLTWIYSAVSFFFGMNIFTIIGVKYTALFCFYFAFYRVARTFWEPKKSLVVTGSLLLFPTYGYEFNRHLSHTILLAAMATATTLVYVRLLTRKTTVGYVLLGLSLGFGILSKDNFIFLPAALALASFSSKKGRETLFDRRMFLSIIIGAVIVLPYALWGIHEKFPTVHEAFARAKSGQLRLDSPWRLVSSFASSFVEALAIPAVFLLFFRSPLRGKKDALETARPVLRMAPFYGVLIPFVVILIFRLGHFSGKWLTPVFFTIPLALFCSFDTAERSLRNFGRLCVGAVVVMLLMRAFIGFFPDITGKLERTHMPIKAVSEQLKKELAAKGIYDLKQLVVVTENSYLAANLEANIPEAEFLSVNDLAGKPLPRKNVVAVWDAKEEGQLVPKALHDCLPQVLAAVKIETPYIHSKKFPPFVLGVAIGAAH